MVRVISFTGLGNKFFTVRSRYLTEKGNDPVMEASFWSFAEARNYVSVLRRLWLLEAFSDYVQHKVILFKSSGGDYYRVQSRLDALTRLENAITLLPTLTTPDICVILQKSQGLLMQVLPHTANHSYDAQLARVGQIMTVANEEINGRLGIFPFKPTNYITYYT